MKMDFSALNKGWNGSRHLVAGNDLFSVNVTWDCSLILSLWPKRESWLLCQEVKRQARLTRAKTTKICCIVMCLYIHNWWRCECHALILVACKLAVPAVIVIVVVVEVVSLEIVTVLDAVDVVVVVCVTWNFNIQGKTHLNLEGEMGLIPVQERKWPSHRSWYMVVFACLSGWILLCFGSICFDACHWVKGFDFLLCNSLWSKTMRKWLVSLKLSDQYFSRILNFESVMFFFLTFYVIQGINPSNFLSYKFYLT